MTAPSSMQEVKVLFQATKWGFGPYEVVEDPDTKMSTRRREQDQKQKGLVETSDFVTKLNHLPPQLNGIVSEKEYLEKMTQLESVLSSHSGPKVPMLIALAYYVAGIAIDIIYEWFAFFMIVLPAASFFISWYIMNSQYTARVENVFTGWTNVKASFKQNVIKGNYALLELRVMLLPVVSVVAIEYEGSMKDSSVDSGNKGSPNSELV